MTEHRGVFEPGHFGNFPLVWLVWSRQSDSALFLILSWQKADYSALVIIKKYELKGDTIFQYQIDKHF